MLDVEPRFVSSETGVIRRVLVVDDSRMQRRILCLMLRRWGFEVVEAESALAGLELCRRCQPDLVLSDWMMPGMNGLDFCRAFRDLDRSSYGYFILLTSKSDKAEVAQGLESGADDFLTKPVSADELRARINAGARILSMERELQKKTAMISETLSELRVLYNGIDKDLRQARVIQQSLIPERSLVFGTSRVSLMLHSCGHVGGDLVGAFAAGTDEFGLYSLDVSGHGITSALITARVAGYLSAAYPEENLALRRQGGGYGFRPPHSVAQRLNDRMTGQQGLSEYLTMCYAQVDGASGRARFVQAGHPPPLLLRRDGAAEFLGTGGLPIGLIDDAGYESHDLRLSSGDRLLMYSDGLTESTRADGTMLGEEGLLALVRDCPSSLAGTDLLDSLYARLGEETGAQQDTADDVSAALLEYDVL